MQHGDSRKKRIRQDVVRIHQENNSLKIPQLAQACSQKPQSNEVPRSQANHLFERVPKIARAIRPVLQLSDNSPHCVCAIALNSGDSKRHGVVVKFDKRSPVSHQRSAHLGLGKQYPRVGYKALRCRQVYLIG
jgi:hypothetical protein